MEKEPQVSEPTVTYGTSDVFHDLELPNADELLAKSKLAIAIHDAIKARGLTQTAAAEIMGIDQPKVSKIVRGRLSEFSTPRMLNYLLRLGLNVDVFIHTSAPVTKDPGVINIAYL